MGEGDHTIDVGEIGQRLRVDVATKVIGNGPGHSGRAVDRGEDADVVASRHPAIRTYDAHEGVSVGFATPLGVDTERIVPGEIAHGQVVHVHMLTGTDGLAGKADDLAIATQRLTLGDVAGGHLVPGRHGLAHLDAFLGEGQAFGQRLASDQHIVQGVESDHGIGGALVACCSNDFHLECPG
ncbi:hypothetical protein D3C76_881560 [compost metagenome]